MSAEPTADIGVTGLAVMGRNLARNFARHGHTVAVHNRTHGADDRAWSSEHGDEGDVRRRSSRWPSSSPRWSGPARSSIMVKAGAADRRGDRRAGRRCWSRATSSSTAATRTSPTPGAARRRCASTGLHFVGTGVSGGEEGALHGPSIMPGGSAESYADARPDARDDRRRRWTARRAAPTSARTAPATS